GIAAIIRNNVISVNHSNGINLLKSAGFLVAGGVLIEGNFIGTDALGTNDPTKPNQDFGNAGNGIFLNQSDGVVIGFEQAPGQRANIVSGNHSSGIFVSGTSDTATSLGNAIVGNKVGLDSSGTREIANAVAGIVLSNADFNTVASNVISGNRLDGILLVNNARN